MAAFATELQSSSPSSNPRRAVAKVQRWGDTAFRLSCQAGALTVIVLAGLLVIVLAQQAWLAIETIGIRFLTSQTWDPEPTHREFGALGFVYGTVATSFIAMVIAVPLGVGTAVFLSEIAPPWLRKLGSFLVEMLAAVPSVVYGFWGLFVLAPNLQAIILALGGPNTGGVGLLPAGLILAVMIVPYVAAVSFDVCRAVPRAQREGALALGASRWQMIWSAVLPYARPGIVGGSFIALGRALGETMAVTMLIGNRTQISFSPFAKGNSIASVIANEFTEATYDLYLSALVELGLVLFLVSIIVNSLARWLIRQMSYTGQRKPLHARLLERFQRNADSSTDTPESRPTSESRTEGGSRPARADHRRAEWTNRVMTVVLGSFFVLAIVPLFLILGHLVYQGIGAINWDFFVRMPAPVGQIGGGMANALYGSCLLVGLATLMAVPIGLLAAIYLVEFRSDRLAPTVRFVGELLGGVPSIVIGIFGYALVVRPMGHFSGWAGGFALGMMMIPVVMRASEEALKLVPQSIRQASHALGAQHFQTVLRVCVPAALPAIITAVFLGIARVGGETAPLLLTASSNQFWPRSPDDFMPSLPMYIFTYAVSPFEEWHRQAWAAALVLITAVMLLNFGIRFVTGRRAVLASHAE